MNGFSRKNIRLKDFDYSKPGAYFVTICTKDRVEYIGNNKIRNIVKSQWFQLIDKFDNIKLDEFVIMPNHIHGIIFMMDTGVINHAPTLGKIIRYYKAKCTKIIHNQTNDQFIWQRNYYDRIIRNKIELNAIRQYIIDNPENWKQDSNNLINQEWAP